MAYRRVYDSRDLMLTAKNRNQLRNPAFLIDTAIRAQNVHGEIIEKSE